VDALADKHEVVVLDSLEPQVHASKPDYHNPDAAYIFGDMRDEAVLRKALEGVEVIFHEAAAVGVGQSMYEIRRVGNEVPETKRGKIGRPIPTSEDKPLHPTSINPFRKSVYKTFRKSFIKKLRGKCFAYLLLLLLLAFWRLLEFRVEHVNSKRSSS